MPYVIAICHQKGGVAKTTTAISLGASFARLGIKTLLVDLDPQANLTSGVGLDSNGTSYSIAEVLTGEVDLASTRAETSLPGLDIIPDVCGHPSGQTRQPLRQRRYRITNIRPLRLNRPDHGRSYILWRTCQ